MLEDEFPYLFEMLNLSAERRVNTEAMVRPRPGLVTEFEFGLDLLLEGFEKSLYFTTSKPKKL